MGKLKFTFTNIFFWVGVICSILIFENITFFTQSDPTEPISLNMEEPYFFILFGIASICYFFLFLYETVYNRSKTNVFLLVLLLGLLGCGVAGIMLYDGMSFDNGSPEIVIDHWSKMKHIMSLVLYIATLYSVIFYFTKNHPSLKRLRFVFFAVIGVTYFFVIYSIVTEYHNYELIANTEDPTTISGYYIKSLFLNSNMFAGFLLMGICASIGLNFFKKNVLSYVSIIGFAIIQVFVCSLTNIIISLSVVILYFLMEIIISFKRKKKSSYFKLFIMLAVTVSIILLFVMCQTFEVKGISPFYRFLYREMHESDYHAFSNRLPIWNATLYASNRNLNTLFLGYGFRNSEYITGGLMGVDDYRISSHNGYLQMLLNFGIVGIFALALFFGYYFYCLIRLLKNDTRFALLFAVIGFAYFALAVTESLIAFAPSAQGILIGALFYLPVVNRWVHYKRKAIADSVIEGHSAPSLLEPKLMVRGAAAFILSLACVVSCFFMFDEFRLNQTVYYTLLNAIIALGILFLTVPYLVGVFSIKGSLTGFITQLLIFGFSLAAISSILVSLKYIPGVDLGPSFLWLTPVVLFTFTLTYLIIASVVIGGSFKLYLNTFASFKTSLGALVGAAMYIVAIYFAKPYLDVNAPIMMGLVGLGMITCFYCFSLIAPFKDTLKVAAYTTEYDASFMKIDVIRDRLERSVA